MWWPVGESCSRKCAVSSYPQHGTHAITTDRPLGDDLLFENRTVYGLAVGTVIEDETVMRQAMDWLGKWVREGQLQLPIGQVYPLSEAARAKDETLKLKHFAAITSRAAYIRSDNNNQNLLADHHSAGEATIYKIHDGICN
ncbi:MAG: hypothetical protein P8N76_18005 [Pirellulaceae bacterium]|nr:hypothetical protein [Pirellulaceae bacterium]